MPLTTLAELDAARARARSEVHKRAVKAGARAAEPLGIASSIWGETVTELIDDIQDIYELTPAQKDELEPALLHGLDDLIAHYAPAAAKAGTLASVAATLRGSTLARKAAVGVATRAATRIGSRVARGAGLGARTAGALVRRAWVIPVALGAGTAALYEILGHRCINQCDAYLRSRLPAPAVAASPRLAPPAD